VFINQVMDVSATYGTILRQQVFGNGITGTEAVRKDFGPNWAQLGFSVSRYYFREPIDDYWQGGPQLSLGRSYGHGSEVSLNYSANPILYDTREQTDTAGLPIPGTSLQFLLQTIGVSWQHYWDSQRRWRSTTRLDFGLNRDNGSGFYDYNQYVIGEHLRFKPGTWEFSVRVGAAYYDYPNQPVSPINPARRHRTQLVAALRVEKELSRHWKLFAAYDYEDSLSNLAVEQYDVNVGSAGVEFSF
jgi:hypothetical protein